MDEKGRIMKNKSQRETEEIFNTEKELRKIEEKIREIERYRLKEKDDSDATRNKNKLSSLVQEIFNKPKPKVIPDTPKYKEVPQETKEQTVSDVVPEKQDKMKQLLKAVEYFGTDDITVLPTEDFNQYINKNQLKSAVQNNYKKSDWVSFIRELNIYTPDEFGEMLREYRKKGFIRRFVEELMK